MNQLVLGDCLEVLKSMPKESVDLIYLDPPFFSNRHYEIVWGDKGEIRSFEDRWSGGIDHYVAWLKERVAEMHRVLKPTGSLFLHCDWHANAYIRVYILDKIFGYSNFKSEIIRERKKGAATAIPNTFGAQTDTIYYYAKNKKKSVFNAQYVFDEDYQRYLDAHFRYVDENGRKYKLENLSAPSYSPTLIYEYKGYKPPKKGWRVSKERMEQMDREGRIRFPKNKDGRIRRKSFLDEVKGRPVQNLWTDINNVQSQSSESAGYPTQKPLALLERIILFASKEGDVVLDPFVGSGTTLVAADRLNRYWIGIDQSPEAIKVAKSRLGNKTPSLFN